jgi:hypothetical protein
MEAMYVINEWNRKRTEKKVSKETDVQPCNESYSKERNENERYLESVVRELKPRGLLFARTRRAITVSL